MVLGLPLEGTCLRLDPCVSDRWMSFIDVDEFMDPAPGLPMKAMGNVAQGRVGNLNALRNELDDDSMASRRK